MNERAQAIAADVRAAFAENIYPGDEHLTVYDPAGRDYDETFQLLRGTTWQDFAIEKFMSGDTPIPDLTAEAFHYFLPGLLIASLDEDNLAADISGTIQFYLSPTSTRADGEFAYDDTERFDRKINLLTPPQRAAIVRVLEEYVARGWATDVAIQSTVQRLREEVRR